MIYEGETTEALRYRIERKAVPINVCDRLVERFPDLPRRHPGDPETLPDSRFWQQCDETAEILVDIMLEINARYFGFDVSYNMGMQLASYSEGQFLIPHYDDTTYHSSPGATNIRLAPKRFRKFTTITMLSDPEDYDGGLRIFFSEEPTKIENMRKGDVIAFPTHVLHDVEPIRTGKRWVVVNWFTGDNWR